MVRYELLELTDRYVRYAYYPEGRKDDYGIIRFDRKTKEPFLEKDDNHHSSEYRGKTYHMIVQYDKEGHFPKQGGVDWY